MSPIKFCPNCEKECEFFEKKRGEMFTIRGVEIPVEITREACSLCGEILFNEKLDEGRVPKVGGNWGSARPVSEAQFGPPS